MKRFQQKVTQNSTSVFVLTGVIFTFIFSLAIFPASVMAAATGNATATLGYRTKCTNKYLVMNPAENGTYTITLKGLTGAKKKYTFTESKAPVNANGKLTLKKIVPGKYNISTTLSLKNQTDDCNPDGPRVDVKYTFKATPLTAIASSKTVDWGKITTNFSQATVVPSSRIFRLFKEANSCTDEEALTCWIGEVFKWSQGAIILLSTVALTIAGVIYMTSAGNTKQIELSKKIIFGALSAVATIVLGKFFLTVVVGVPWL